MIELPEAAAAAQRDSGEVWLPERGDERSDARDARNGSLRPRRGAGARPTRAALTSGSAAGRGGEQAGIALEICGEAASDPLSVPLLVGLGDDELSVGAARVGSCAEMDPRARLRRDARSSRARRSPRATPTRSSGSRGRSRRQLRVSTRRAARHERPSASSPSRSGGSRFRPWLPGRARREALGVDLALAGGHLELAAKPIAVRTKSAAGRAWRSTPPGSVDDDGLRACLRHARPPPIGRHRRVACSPRRSPPLRPRPPRSARPPAARGRCRCRSSTWRTVRIALPRSPRTTTPEPWSAAGSRRARGPRRFRGRRPEDRRRARCARRVRPSARRELQGPPQGPSCAIRLRSRPRG